MDKYYVCKPDLKKQNKTINNIAGFLNHVQ